MFCSAKLAVSPATATFAPPASDNKPAAPSIGATFLRRFRFEACAACGIELFSDEIAANVRPMETDAQLIVRLAGRRVAEVGVCRYACLPAYAKEHRLACETFFLGRHSDCAAAGLGRR
jgi:hypothetical protein